MVLPDLLVTDQVKEMASHAECREMDTLLETVLVY